MMTDLHATHVERLHDPYLGWKWVVVCTFCGAFGRQDEKVDAESIAERHAEIQGYERSR